MKIIFTLLLQVTFLCASNKNHLDENQPFESGDSPPPAYSLILRDSEAPPPYQDNQNSPDRVSYDTSDNPYGFTPRYMNIIRIITRVKPFDYYINKSKIAKMAYPLMQHNKLASAELFVKNLTEKTHKEMFRRVAYEVLERLITEEKTVILREYFCSEYTVFTKKALHVNIKKINDLTSYTYDFFEDKLDQLLIILICNTSQNDESVIEGLTKALVKAYQIGSYSCVVKYIKRFDRRGETSRKFLIYDDFVRGLQRSLPSEFKEPPYRLYSEMYDDLDMQIRMIRSRRSKLLRESRNG